jgi:cell division protein FtsB
VTAQVPPGVIVLGFALGFALALFAYAAWQRTAQLIEERRVAREVADLRNLAANAEASRLRELREELAAQMAALRRTIDESANGIAASVGQLDDKLDRLRSDGRGLPAPGLEPRKEARPGQ